MADTISSDSVAQDQLRAFIERIERMEEEKKAIADDIREIYGEAKSNGFDVKVLRAIIRIRKMDHQERLEQEALLALYMSALGMQAAPREDFDDDDSPPRGSRHSGEQRPAALEMPSQHIVERDQFLAKASEGKADTVAQSAATPDGDASRTSRGVDTPATIQQSPIGDGPSGDPAVNDRESSLAGVEGDEDRHLNSDGVGEPGAILMRGGAEAARLAHNQEDGGSSPSRATNPVANVEEEASGRIAVASDDPASRGIGGADRQRPTVSGFTGDAAVVSKETARDNMEEPGRGAPAAPSHADLTDKTGEASAAPAPVSLSMQRHNSDPRCLDKEKCGQFTNFAWCNPCRLAAGYPEAKAKARAEVAA